MPPPEESLPNDTFGYGVAVEDWDAAMTATELATAVMRRTVVQGVIGTGFADVFVHGGDIPGRSVLPSLLRIRRDKVRLLVCQGPSWAARWMQGVEENGTRGEGGEVAICGAVERLR